MLVEVGRQSIWDSEPGNLVVAVSPETGKVGWKTPGAYAGTVVPAEGPERRPVSWRYRGSSFNFDLVISRITSK